MMFNFNLTPFKGMNVFATSKLSNFFENKTEFHLEEFFEQEGVIEEIKLSCQAANNYFAHHTKYTKLFLDYIIEDQTDSNDDSKIYKYPYMASEIFSCELNGIIDNFFNDAEIDIHDMVRLKSVDISQIQSPLLPQISDQNDQKINEQMQVLDLDDRVELQENRLIIDGVKKLKMGEYLFDNLNRYFMNSNSFINPTSAVYFQKVIYALMNKKGYETFKTIFEKKELLKNCLKNVDLKPFAEIIIRFLLLDSCYNHMNIPIFLSERKEIVEKLFEEFNTNKNIEVLDNIAYILVETINRNTSGNSGKEILGFILQVKHIDSILEKFDKSSEHSSNIISNNLQILQSLISFCILEEIRNNYKSPFVNCDIENECERLCSLFLQKFNEKIPDFLEFLQTPKENKNLNTSWKEKIKIFGLEKMRLIELLTSVLKFKSEKFLSTMLENDVYSKLFNIFKSHPFNSMLHNVIYSYIKQSIDLNNEKVNSLFFEKSALLNFVIDLSKDDMLRVNTTPKKISKGFNGYVVLLIQLIYNNSHISPELEQIIDENAIWKNFLTEYYKPYLLKISFELGGYHPRTKKESVAFTPEDDEMMFFFDQRPKVNLIGSPYADKNDSYKYNGWTNATSNNGINGYNKAAEFMTEMSGDYDYYFEDSLNLSLNQSLKTNGVKEKTVEEISKQLSEKNKMPEINEKDSMEEEERELDNINRNAETSNKCRFEYEEDYFFD